MCVCVCVCVCVYLLTNSYHAHPLGYALPEAVQARLRSEQHVNDAAIRRREEVIYIYICAYNYICTYMCVRTHICVCVCVCRY